jgi:hypothetical protein
MVSHADPDISVEPMSAGEIARRMAASVAYERLPLVSAWLSYRFAFPDKSSPLFERLDALQRAGLERLLEGKQAYVVRHPYPCRLEDLFEAMSPHCDPLVPRTISEPKAAPPFLTPAMPEQAGRI